MSEIFALDSPQIADSRKEDIRDFVGSAVNGDDPTAHLVVNAGFREGREGAIAYILTDKRLIKIDIDEKEAQSSSFLLRTIIGIERSMDGDRAQFNISFQNGSFGLKYPKDNKKIAEFLQQLDQARIN